jgi:predicted FMN-binding regulatory protein PaiB
MQHYDRYKQDDFQEICDLIDGQKTCLLQTLSETNEIQTGLFNPLYLNKRVYFHVNRSDEQIESIRLNGICQLIFQDVLAIFPSHWADDLYAGAATTYYRFAELNCKVRIIEDVEEKPYFLQRLMERYQPEGKYEPISYESGIYRKKLKAILVLECEIIGYKGKWKLGQNRSVEERLSFIEKFRERNEGHDRRCADEIVKWIKAHPDR